MNLRCFDSLLLDCCSVLTFSTKVLMKSWKQARGKAENEIKTQFAPSHSTLCFRPLIGFLAWSHFKFLLVQWQDFRSDFFPKFTHPYNQKIPPHCLSSWGNSLFTVEITEEFTSEVDNTFFEYSVSWSLCSREQEAFSVKTYTLMTFVCFELRRPLVNLGDEQHRNTDLPG